MKRIAIVLAAALGLAGVARADAGQETFEKKCASCHGKDGEGKTQMGAKLHIEPYSKKAKDLTVGQISAVVANGIPDKKMPAFSSKLDQEEITAVARYVEATFGAAAPAAQKAEEAKPEETKKAGEAEKAGAAEKVEKAKKPAKAARKTARKSKAKKGAPDAGAPAAPAAQ